ncbi:hypothetical protein ACB094_03G006800 [Castanea mollissima]
MAGALLSAIVERLGSLISSEFKLTVTVEEEVQKLQTKFRTIQAVLNDAEKRQLKDEAVKLWVDKLEGVSYEIDDVLDEWNTVRIKAEIEEQQKKFEEEEKAETSTAKKMKWTITSNFNFSVPNLSQHRDIAHKIKALHEKFDEIYEESRMYKFVLRDPKLNEKFVERPKTIPSVDLSDFFGRDEVKKDLVSILLGEGTEKGKHPHVISLVGMGGIGKTTLAQLAYNDQDVQAHFDIKVWVCVSEPFDQCRVAKTIVEALGGGGPTITELPSLMKEICRLIGGKKLFLVFDDVWTEDDAMWKPFRDSLKNYASQSSRILVTTRKDKVARKMKSANTIKLEVLSDENCWLVFSKIAFFDKGHQQREQLEHLGRQISKKCKGLPLAATTLGSLMRFKESREEWSDVLENDSWKLEEDVERGDLCNLQFLRLGQVWPSQLIILPQGVGPFSMTTIGPNDRRIESNVLILNALELPQDLEKLYISNYLGTTMSPRLLASLTNLKELHLLSATELMSLPPLGKIPHLESLFIWFAGSLKKVGVEFLGIESENKKEDIKIFPNLKYLYFFDLGQWEEWIGGTREGGKEDEDCITIMPRLQELTIECCGKLKSLPDFLRTTPLQELEIIGCPIIQKRCRRETGEDWRNISHIPNIKLRDW